MDNLTIICEKLIEQIFKDIERVKTLKRPNKEQNMEELREKNQKIEENEKHQEIIYEKIQKLTGLYETLGQKFLEVAERFRQILNLRQQRRDQQQNMNQRHGLTPGRIQRFQIFSADETLVGEQCAICLEDINIGKRMRRLTCDGQHAFCPGCCETWFANKNTCPLCRHVFV